MELQIPSTSVWRVLRQRLSMKPYRIQLLQALGDGDREKRLKFCEFALHEQAQDENFLSRLIFSDEATFHISGQVNRHNVRIWGLEQPHHAL